MRILAAISKKRVDFSRNRLVIEVSFGNRGRFAVRMKEVFKGDTTKKPGRVKKIDRWLIK